MAEGREKAHLPLGENCLGGPVGKGPRHPGTGHLHAGNGQFFTGSGDHLPQGLSGAQKLVLSVPADAHHGAVELPGHSGIVPGLSAHPVQDFLFPLGVEYRKPLLLFHLGHLFRAAHPPEEQGQKLAVNIVDFLPNLG